MHASFSSLADPDPLDDAIVLDTPLAFVMPLAGPFGALLLLAMAWLSMA